MCYHKWILRAQNDADRWEHKRRDSSVYYHVDQSGTVEGLKAAFDHAHKSRPAALYIYSCDENGFLKRELDPYLQSLPVPICGGIYPRLVANGQILEKGSIVIGGYKPSSFMVIPDLSDDTVELDKAIDDYFPPII